MTDARAAFLSGPNRIEIEEHPIPVAGVDDAVIRVEANGLCGSDIEQILSGGRQGRIVPGHEPLGIIESIGPEASRRWGVGVGDRIVVEVVLPCHECRQCARQVFSSCEASLGGYGARPFPASTPLQGGMAEYMYVHPNSIVHRMDASVPVATAAMYNALAAGIRWANHLGGVQPGDTVVILGAGQRGIAAAIAATSAGAEHVIATGLARDAHKLRIAREFGVQTTIFADQEDVVERVSEATAGRGADVVLDVTPSAAQPVRDAVEVARMGSTVVLAGLKHGRPIEVVTDKLIQKGLRVIGARGVEGRSIREAIAIIESGAYPLEKLGTHTFGLDGIVEAVQVLSGRVEGEHALNIAILP
ncbi:alcohol dehydrogenase catalytic domain-containing protein [Agromyces sp. H66]|uniref:zinc-dependent alcohol dehydrogenase n=1 Tax=Agromyces sp. H66 TaxID=2529859 RepID=UPI0010AA7E8E|nr:alcohol dehydrogenase catalytic domain-containing protein [Agromyces sp. H66]